MQHVYIIINNEDPAALRHSAIFPAAAQFAVDGQQRVQLFLEFVVALLRILQGQLLTTLVFVAMALTFGQLALEVGNPLRIARGGATGGGRITRFSLPGIANGTPRKYKNCGNRGQRN
jgi:hypothetical protein